MKSYHLVSSCGNIFLQSKVLAIFCKLCIKQTTIYVLRQLTKL